MIDANVTFDCNDIIINGFKIYKDGEYFKVEGERELFLDAEEAVNYCLEYDG